MRYAPANDRYRQASWVEFARYLLPHLLTIAICGVVFGVLVSIALLAWPDYAPHVTDFFRRAFDVNS